MNKIVFHIGTPKTGTTAIQRFLYDNRIALNDCGWSYPDLYLKVDKVGHFNGTIRNGNIFNAEQNAITNRGELWDGICKYLGELVKDKNIIISDEDFYYA
ncbi:MAG: hypothetical protein K6B41_02005, partial [Butyrivibrio sp.]|nr:hypothetical protein [Butyrivibrio sp.]